MRSARQIRGLGLALLPAALVLAPLAYLLALVLEAGPGTLVTAIGRAGPLELLANVGLLAAGTTAWALLLAAPLAWLGTRSDLRGARVVQWLAPLPLAIPPYVGAIVYASLLAPGGLVDTFLGGFSGGPSRAISGLLPIYSLGGGIFVLGLFTYPYLFLLLRAALLRLDPALEEAARSLGQGPWQSFLQVTLPAARPALLGGGLLVFLYAVVDFGVVSLLRVRTFTTVIYNYLLAGFSLAAAAGLSLVLVGIVALLLFLQQRTLGAGRYSQRGTRSGTSPRVRLGSWRWLGWAYLLLVLTLSLGVPLAVLAWQVARLGSPAEIAAFLGSQFGYLRNTLIVAVGGTTLALAAATALAWLASRVAGATLAGAFLQAGYAIPGTVLGLALVGLYLRATPWLYGTPLALAIAYFILYAAPAYQGARAALAQVPPSLEEAARALGRSPLQAFREVVVPLVRPGLAGAWLLSFILSVRELAATLILRPPGFDTLAVRIWVHMMDVGPDPRGAAVALLLVAAIAVTWLLLLIVRPPHTPMAFT